MQIAIDGPSGAGKSTIAKLISKKLNIEYLDTGAMYRALGYKLKNYDIENEKQLNNVLINTSLTVKEGDIYLDGKNIESLIRSEQAALDASLISDNTIIRNYLVDLQRLIGKNNSIVMDGRDIGSAVLPNADFKFYLTADPSIRAQRRYKQLIEAGETTSFEEVLDEIKQRDHQDSTRVNSPLKKAKDAILIDSTDKTINEIVDTILNYIEGE